MKKVLIVEDERSWQDKWRQQLLDSQVILLSAYSIEEAEELFAANPDIDAIVMDGCLNSEELNTLRLVRKFRRTFTGPMLAASSGGSNCERLCQAGCDNYTGKSWMPVYLLKALRLPVTDSLIQATGSTGYFRASNSGT